MRFPENNTSLLIDEFERTSSSNRNKILSKDDHPSIQSHTSIPYTIDKNPSPYIYTVGNNEFIESKRLFKRASWSPAVLQECGLPPTGKRIDSDQSLINKNSNRVRTRSKQTRHGQDPVRPVSLNENYDRISIDDYQHKSLNRNESSLNQRTMLTTSVDTITTRALPSVDNNHFVCNTSTIPSVPVQISSRRTSPTFDRIHSSTTRPLLSEYQQQNSNHINYKFLSPNTVSISSPISSLPSSTSTPSSSSSFTSFTCPKGHEQLSPSPIKSSPNQYTKSTTQTLTVDTTLDDTDHPKTTSRSTMTVSLSPNQPRLTNAIITSSPITINNSDGLNQHRDQKELTIIPNSCLKTQKTKNNRTKKSVHFDCHLPTVIRSTRSNYQPSVAVASSSLSTGNSSGENDEQKKKYNGETVKEKEKIETTTRRTMITTTPLTNTPSTIHRSLSLSPSQTKEENNDSRRRHRQEKKENVNELNCPTGRRVTTAATHLHCPTTAVTVTFNDGNGNISQTKEANGTNNSNANEHLTHSSADKQMPLNNLLIKTSSLNPIITPPIPTTKKFISTGGLFSFIHRSHSNNKKSSSNEENKQLRRTSSTQRKSKQHKCLSADVETLLPHSTKEATDKVTINRQSTKDNTTDSSTPLYTNMNRSSISMSRIPIKSDEADSLNNGLLFQPVQSLRKKDTFFLSPTESLSNNDQSLASIGNKMMQTSTLIISTPPQYHYYLYPPSSTSSSVSKKNSITNRTISNVSINSVSTNSSSSSYESPMHDNDDDTLSCSTYSIINTNKKQVVQSALNDWKLKTSPVILSDSVQAFWPPPPPPSSILSSDPGQTIMASTAEQNKHSDSINHKHKQFESNTIQTNGISSTYNDDSLPMSNGNRTDALPPTSSLMVNNKEEVRSYSEQSAFNNGCLRKASDSSIEDTQASYSERLREKSRSITITTPNRSMAVNVTNHCLSRSRSKDALNDCQPCKIQINNSNNLNKPEHLFINGNVSRPKSAGQIHGQPLLSPLRQETSNDFQSKRQFFENRTYTDYIPTFTYPKVNTISPSNTSGLLQQATINNNQQHDVTRRSWYDLSSRQQPPPPPPPPPDSVIRTTKYFDSSSNHALLPQSINRKPVRIVKAVQRSAPSPINNFKMHSEITCNDYNLKTFPPSYPNNHSFNELIMINDHHLSTEYIRHLFPIPDCHRRNRSRQNSATTYNNDIRIVPNDVRQTEDLLINSKKRLEIFKENQRIINDETEMNTILGTKLINIIELKAELYEIEKFKLHISEIDTITSVLLKLSSRLAKVENDLLMITDHNDHTKASLLERREKIQQKHDEAKSLKDGIDRRSRLVTNILRKYFSDEQFDDYDHFIRMKPTLLMDMKDIEENIAFVQKQIQILLNLSSSSSPSIVNNTQQYSSTSSVSLCENLSTSTHIDNLQKSYLKAISTTA